MELLQVGEVVEANEGFFFYDAYFPKGYKFEIEPQHVGHGFEKWVTKVKCVMCKQVLYSNGFEYFDNEIWCKSCFEQESEREGGFMNKCEGCGNSYNPDDSDAVFEESFCSAICEIEYDG